MLEKRRKTKYTPAQRKLYQEQGGAAILDQIYTVYGEVIKGMDVVDKIAKADRDRFREHSFNKVRKFLAGIFRGNEAFFEHDNIRGILGEPVLC